MKGKRYKIFITDPYPADTVERLKIYGEVSYEPKIDREELLKRVIDTDILIVRSRTKVDRELIEKAKNLKLVITGTHGTDHVDEGELMKRGIVFQNIAAQTESVAEHAIALMMALAKDIVKTHEALIKGRWIKPEVMGIELKGKTLGIIGLGKIGKRVAELANVIGMNVIAFDPYVNEEDAKKVSAKLVSLEYLLKNSDIVSLHVPLTSETRHMISEKELGMMKKEAILINTSRGGVIDDEALYKALKEGKISKAGLDVFEVEPPFGSKLLELSNVIVTPHIAGQTYESRIRTSEGVVKVITDFVKSKR